MTLTSLSSVHSPVLSSSVVATSRRSVLALLAAAPAAPALAQFRVEISGVGLRQLPIALPALRGEGTAPQKISQIIQADLERSGLFRGVPAGDVQLDENSVPDMAQWRQRAADALSCGSLTKLADGRYDVRFRLWDVVKAQDLGGQGFVVVQGDLRLVAHRIADYIYEKLTGKRGAFNTRLSYVNQVAGKYQLLISDSDGQNAQAALKSREPIISPTWSPDGTRLAYVSFENKKPVVYVHSLASGKRVVVANFKGSNSAPAWSPDGRRLAVVLSKEGGSQIFIVNADGSGLQRITMSAGINTEPFFSPDGQSLYFTSDRGGSPQIYRSDASGGDAQRVTFEGSYNVSPRISPDGKTLAFISRRDGGFRLAVMDLESKQVQILTDSNKDESPSFAPNSRMILIATESGGRGTLSAVSIDGRIKQRLSISAGDVREPAWGPFYK
mgnify:CR=1 FL=1